jgi:hypothetical protein
MYSIEVSEALDTTWISSLLSTKWQWKLSRDKPHNSRAAKVEAEVERRDEKVADKI